MDPEGMPSWLCTEEEEEEEKLKSEELEKDELRRSRSRSERRKDEEYAPGDSAQCEDEEEEKMEEGGVGYIVYKDFFRARGFLMTAIMLLSAGTFCGLMVLGNFWLSKWSEGPIQLANGTMSDNNVYLGYYGLTGIIEVFGISGFAIAGWVSVDLE